mgnify:CR=1 FL=1
MINTFLQPMINTHIACVGLLVLLLLSSSFGRIFVVHAADEDSLQDVCVADVTAAIHGNGHTCKPAALVEAEDFVFRGLRHGPNATL